MIVFYENPNVHTILLGKDSKSNLRRKIKFIPGKNIVKNSLWKEFKTVHSNIFDCLLSEGTLKVFSEDDNLDYEKLSKSESRELIVNTMEIEPLKLYKVIESKRNYKRKEILALIENQIKKLSADFSKDAQEKKLAQGK